ncbi:DUF1738 domain-containing protein [Bradyrhizobium manausense]|jgi:antirestriction protein ArdC|uniref:ArdC family protein n=1 Tax=Bradyrhizobium manausense TaxID=989370 RepID=UPI001BABDAA2|nr:ArdC-like ssDNA-binding domain-containing protein [Bradyrhizobium manausense]MBR1089363.1 DUF1738 domain-containing protein [Bradyrhizobium manausense]
MSTNRTHRPESTSRGSAASFSEELSTNPHMDVYQRVTDKIIRELEKGTRSWIKPWTSSPGQAAPGRPLRHDGIPYRGINVLILWSEAMERGFASTTWMTYRQAKALGSQVRKGEHGATIVYAKSIELAEDDPSANEETVRRIPLLRAYTVFNVEQIEGLPTPTERAQTIEPISSRIDSVDTFIAATTAKIVHRGNRACYLPSADHIEMPPYRQFIDTPTSSAAQGYYATLLHELIHYAAFRIMPRRCAFPWTGEQHRRGMSA